MKPCLVCGSTIIQRTNGVHERNPDCCSRKCTDIFLYKDKFLQGLCVGLGFGEMSKALNLDWWRCKTILTHIRKSGEPDVIVAYDYYLQAKKANSGDERNWWSNHKAAGCFRSRRFQKRTGYFKKYFKRIKELKTNDYFARQLRIRVSGALRYQGVRKSERTSSLTGCSVPQLRNWLENRFKSGMSWGNYGQWHIDHIIPCAVFDLSKPEERKKCFHFSNLQPLWDWENHAKNRYVRPAQPELLLIAGKTSP